MLLCQVRLLRLYVVMPYNWIYSVFTTVRHIRICQHIAIIFLVMYYMVFTGSSFDANFGVNLCFLTVLASLFLILMYLTKRCLVPTLPHR